MRRKQRGGNADGGDGFPEVFQITPRQVPPLQPCSQMRKRKLVTTQPVRGGSLEASRVVPPQQPPGDVYSAPWRERGAVVSSSLLSPVLCRTLKFDSLFLPSRPVHWEANDTALTWHDQLSGKDRGSLMDPVSGGQQLQIFQPAIYRCFVEQELIAQFNPAVSVELLEAERQAKGQGRWQPRTQPGKADSVLRGLKLMLLMVSVLVVGGLLCKVVFRPTRGKRRNLVLLVK